MGNQADRMFSRGFFLVFMMASVVFLKDKSVREVFVYVMIQPKIQNLPQTAYLSS